VATSVWFGDGDFGKTLQLAVHAADFADTDCNSANSESVVAAMHGMKALPSEQVSNSMIGFRGRKWPTATHAASRREYFGAGATHGANRRGNPRVSWRDRRRKVDSNSRSRSCHPTRRALQIGGPHAVLEPGLDDGTGRVRRRGWRNAGNPGITYLTPGAGHLSSDEVREQSSTDSELRVRFIFAVQSRCGRGTCVAAAGLCQ